MSQCLFERVSAPSATNSGSGSDLLLQYTLVPYFIIIHYIYMYLDLWPEKRDSKFLTLSRPRVLPTMPKVVDAKSLIPLSVLKSPCQQIYAPYTHPNNFSSQWFVLPPRRRSVSDHHSGRKKIFCWLKFYWSFILNTNITHLLEV